MPQRLGQSSRTRDSRTLQLHVRKFGTLPLLLTLDWRGERGWEGLGIGLGWGSGRGWDGEVGGAGARTGMGKWEGLGLGLGWGSGRG